MKKTIVLLVMVVFGFAGLCMGSDYTHPDLAKQSNVQKGTKLISMLDQAQKKIAAQFPGYVSEEDWKVYFDGYGRLYSIKANGRLGGYVSVLVSHDGGVYVQVNYGEMLALK